jgi:hypothetical protein
MAKTPEERRARRQQLETEFIENIEQILGFPLMPWQRPLILAVRRASLEGNSLDVKTMVEDARRG